MITYDGYRTIKDEFIVEENMIKRCLFAFICCIPVSISPIG